MKVERIETPGISHRAYLIADGSHAALVDPRRDIEDYLAAARKIGAQIEFVIETHRQEDFVMGSAYLARRTGARIVNREHECFGHGDLRLADGESFDLGSLVIRALATPGHTPESTCYAVYAGKRERTALCVFTGDTLFFGDTGRTDLPDEDAAVDNAALLYDSVHSRLSDLGDTALVFPAHGPGSVCGSGMADRAFSTIGEEKRYNDVFVLDRDEFAARKGGERLPRPPYFRYTEEVNLGGGLEPAIRPGDVKLLDSEQFAKSRAGKLVFDTREPEGFAGGHLEGSYSIWLQGLPVFGGWIGDARSAIYLVTERDDDVDTAAMHLARIGIDNVQGALAGGLGAWRSAGEPIQFSGVITPRELSKDTRAYQVLDVREQGEFAGGHIPGSKNVFVGDLPRELDSLDLDPSRPVVVTCGVGHRAGLGVSLLRRHGFDDVRNLLGGLQAWRELQLPLKE